MRGGGGEGGEGGGQREMELNVLGRQELERRDSRLVRVASKPYILLMYVIVIQLAGRQKCSLGTPVFLLPLPATPTPEKTHPVLSKALPTSLRSTNLLQILLLLLLSPPCPVQ